MFKILKEIVIAAIGAVVLLIGGAIIFALFYVIYLIETGQF